MKANNRFIFILLFLCDVTFAFAADPSPITVGVVLPLTGNAAAYGTEAVRAIQTLEQDPNVTSKVRFILEDGKCGAGNAAATAVQKLLKSDSAQMLLLGCSGEVLQTAPAIEHSRVPTVCVLCSHPDVKRAGKYIFRTYLDIDPGVDLLAEYVLGAGFERIGILTETSSFTAAIEKRLLEKLGNNVVFSETFAPDEQDYRNSITRARLKKPDAFYLNAGSPPKYQTMFRQLRALGVSAPVFSYFNPGEKTSRESLGTAQDGVIFFDSSDVDESTASQSYREFLKAYRKKFPQGIEAPFLLATAYNALQAIIQASEFAGTEPDKVISLWNSAEIAGAQGAFRFDTNGDMIGPKWALHRFVGGETVSIVSERK